MKYTIRIWHIKAIVEQIEMISTIGWHSFVFPIIENDKLFQLIW